MSREQPLVSVMLPTYNQAAFVHESLMSLVEQDYDRLEVVVRDDGSSDGTPDIIAQIAAQYPERVRVLPGGVNLGITRNFNTIMRECAGHYVGVIGGDDVALPGKVARQVEWFEEDARHVLCHHDVEVFDSETGRTLYLYSHRHPLRAGSAAQLLRYPGFCTGQAVMLRRSCLPPGLHDNRIRHASDWLLWMETLLSRGPDNPGAGFVPGVLSRYRRHASNVTDRADDYGLQESLLALDILEARAPELRAALRIARSERLATYGFRRVLRGEVTQGWALVARAAALTPRGLSRSLRNAVNYFGATRRQQR